MSRGVKWSVFTFAFVLVLGVAFVEMVLWIGRSEWKEKRVAVQRAYEQTILYSSQKVQPFVGDSPYMVVFGQDKLKKDMLVWVGEQGVHAEYAADGISAQDAEQKVTARDPDNRVIRASAGKWMDDYAWEVFYKKSEGAVTRYYYDYYRFADGQYLDTYNLMQQ